MAFLERTVSWHRSIVPAISFVVSQGWSMMSLQAFQQAVVDLTLSVREGTCRARRP